MLTALLASPWNGRLNAGRSDFILAECETGTE